MSNSKLATYQKLSPNCTKPRNGTIKGVAIHCTAGSPNNTAKQIVDGARFVTYNAKTGASCHYAVGGDGSIAQGCLEENRAWCTSNTIDHQIVTIEVATDKKGIKVNEKAVDALVNLLVDICQRNGIKKLLWKGDKSLMRKWDKQNMVVHRWTANKACPGDTLYNRHPEIAERVNSILQGDSTVVVKTDSEEVKEVQDVKEVKTEFQEYHVRITADELNIRKGASVSYQVVGTIRDKGIYTITEEQNGWGRLKSDAGWINLKYTKKV